MEGAQHKPYNSTVARGAEATTSESAPGSVCECESDHVLSDRCLFCSCVTFDILR